MQFASTSALQNNNVANAFAAYLRKANQAARLVMLTTLVPFFLGLASCSKPDTIAPVANQTVETARQSASDVLNADGFEGVKPSNFWIAELPKPTSGVVTGEQRRSGNQSMKFSWKPSWNDGTNASLHSELGTDALKNGETERWYGYSLYMPSSTMANDPQSIICSQWHGVADPGFEDTIPPLAFYLELGNQLKLYYRSSTELITKPLQVPTSQKIIRLGTMTFDKWVDYVVHVKWDPAGNTGILQVWQDGVQVVNEVNINIGYRQMRKPYWKAGLYAWTGKAAREERTVYFDEVRIGKASAGYDAVKPGQSDNTARARTN